MLPYTADVYFALLGRYLADLGLLAAGFEVLVVMAMVAATLGSRPGWDRAVAGLVAGSWLVTGLVFHGLYFSGLNFLAPVYAGLFAAQGLLLAWQGLWGRRLAFGFRGGGRGWAGMALTLAALAYPLLDGLMRPEWLGLRLVGLTPTPTVLLTLGLLLLAERPPRRLLIVPALWSGVAAVTGWHLGIFPDLALPVLVIATGLLLLRRRNGRNSRSRMPARHG